MGSADMDSGQGKHIISLGAGVQSSTMALMAACGEIEPMPTHAIFADTQAEPASVYRWLDGLRKLLPFPVISATYGDLAGDALKLRRSKKSGNLYSKAMIPIFMKKPDGTKGILPRRCTRDYKIHVVERELRKILGVRSVRYKSPLITSWIGISYDEADRMKESRLSWILNWYPLVERRITREDCLAWMEHHGYPRPPRSACVFCPYHSDAEWVRLQTEEPEEFAKAVEWERAHTKIVAADEITTGIPFLHDSLVPLDQVKFEPEKASRKINQFRNECEGMCGV